FNWAWLLADMEEYAPAEQLFREVLENCRQRRGKEPRGVAVARVGLAPVLVGQGRDQEAFIIFEARASLEKQEGGRNIARALASYVAAMAKREGPWPFTDYQGAVNLLRESVQIAKLSVGEEHPYLTIGLTELARTFEKMGKDNEAEQHY